MNIKKYIESGILENYILGLVTKDERAEVMQYINQYPEIKKELNLIEDTLADYAQLHQVTPPAHIRANILKKIESLDKTTPPSSKSQGNNNRLLGLLGILFLLSAFAALYFYQQYNTTQQEWSELKTSYESEQMRCDSIQAQNQALERQSNGLEEQIAFLMDKDKQVTPMKGTEKAPEAIAEIHWNAETKKAFIDIGNMPAPTAGKQYQLWAIVDGKPVDMKSITLDAKQGTLIAIDFIENAQAFAITLEVEGGNPTPTMEEMYVVGNV